MTLAIPQFMGCSYLIYLVFNVLFSLVLNSEYIRRHIICICKSLSYKLKNKKCPNKKLKKINGTKK